MLIVKNVHMQYTRSLEQHTYADMSRSVFLTGILTWLRVCTDYSAVQPLLNVMFKKHNNRRSAATRELKAPKHACLSIWLAPETQPASTWLSCFVKLSYVCLPISVPA